MAKYGFIDGKYMTMAPGDIITVLGEIDKNWSKGYNSRTGETNLFPSSYVNNVDNG